MSTFVLNFLKVMKSVFINKVILFPYYLILKTRHYLFDNGIFKSYKFDIPVISIGNLTVGGTGKTPHTEYMIKGLMSHKRVAVLSRGYGRKTKGFRFVETTDKASMSGDEPLQIKRKFPSVTVAVDANRVRGIKALMEMDPQQRPQVILLDDAFQHRRVIPSTCILLVDYNLPPDENNLLPFGRLRDLPSQIERADIIIVTKCPSGLSNQEMFIWRNRLKTFPNQKIFFSSIKYGEPQPLFEEGDKRYIYSKFAIQVAGIANPKPMEYYLINRYKIVKKILYRDHHIFNNYDIKKINKISKKYSKAVIITTEKDSQRMIHLTRFCSETKKRIFMLPIEVDGLPELFIEECLAV